MSLPTFTYHPDPIATGSIKPSDAMCVCCNQHRGFIYVCNTYCEEELVEALCPWCIADGSAAKRFDAIFSDDSPLVQAGIPAAVVEEVTRRTPGYTSWQQDEWQCCCGDACEFHGDPSRAHLAAMPQPLEEVISMTRWTPDEWVEFVRNYQPGKMSVGIYHFICRHCKQARYGVDCN